MGADLESNLQLLAFRELRKNSLPMAMGHSVNVE